MESGVAAAPSSRIAMACHVESLCMYGSAAQSEPLQCAGMAGQPEPQTLSIRPLIARELQEMAVEHGRMLAPLTNEIKLVESGLDSPDVRN
jgi:hypothetical protein